MIGDCSYTQLRRWYRGCVGLVGLSVVLAWGLGMTNWGHAHEGHKRQRAAAEAGQTPVVKLGQMAIPKAALLDQYGETVQLYEDLIKDKVVAISFIYTTCTTVCLPIGANFAKLQTLLGERLAADMNLITVTIDPVTDTPQRLRAWGEKFKVGPGWRLLTGSKEAVDGLLKGLKVFTADIVDHAPILLVGDDRTGTWTRMSGFTPPNRIAKHLKAARASHTSTASTR